jgi:tripartite ATP-independent transporter DctP family solute receptor
MATNGTAFVPIFEVFGMPYLVRSTDHYYKIPDSFAGKIIQDEADKAGFVILAYWDTGLENIYNSRRPITKPEDLKGLKIRTRESPVLIDTVNAMGGSGAPLATPEVFTALQTKVFDGGVQSSVGFAMVFKYAEICKYYSLTEHALEGTLFMASKKRFDKLPKEIQNAIRQAGRESMEYMHRQVTPAEEREALDVMNKYGVKLNKVDKEVFIKSVAPVQAKYKTKFRGDLIDGIANLIK